MASTHLLRIVDSAGTINLVSGDNIKLVSYDGPVASFNGSPVQENARINFVSTPAANRANIATINKYLEQARNYARTETGSRVYLELDPGTSGTVYRSMLFDGNITLPQNWFAVYEYDNIIQAEIEWTRQPFWDGPLTAVPITNTYGTSDVAGLQVDNADDVSHENTVAIAAGDIIGDMPAPVKIEMYNAYSAAATADEFYIFHNVYSNPATFAHILEGEAGTGGSITITAEGTPGASGTAYAAIQWDGTVESKIATWALSSAELDAAAGGRFSVLARWNASFPYSDCYFRLKLETANNVLWSGDLDIANTRELQHLDTLRLPPYLAGQTSLKGINMCLYARRETAGTHTVNLDYLQLSPVSGYAGWKRFNSVDTGVEYQGYLYHDDTEGYDYRVDTSGDKIAEFTAYGGPILLVPNKNQGLYFLSCDTNGSALVEQSWTVKLWYRPRRSSI